MTIIIKRYESLFRWLAVKDMGEYSNKPNSSLFEMYTKENNLNLTYHHFANRSWSKVAEIIRDSTKFSIATKAKILIILKIPIVDGDLFKMLKEEDNNIALRTMDKTIYKFCSKRGIVQYCVDHLIYKAHTQRPKRNLKEIDSNKNFGQRGRAASKDSSVENQEPSAKKARMEPTGSSSSCNKQPVLFFNLAPSNPWDQFRNDSNSNSILQIQARNRAIQEYYDRVEDYQKKNDQIQAADDYSSSDEFFGQEDEVSDPVPVHNYQPAPIPSCSFMAAQFKKEPVLKLPKNEGVRRSATPPVESPPVEETPLDILKNLETPTTRKTVFELLRQFVLCLKEFDHLGPIAAKDMISKLKIPLIHYSALSHGEGILVKAVLNEIHYLVCQMHNGSIFLQNVYNHWKTIDVNRRVYEEDSIRYEHLQKALIDIIESLPPV